MAHSDESYHPTEEEEEDEYSYSAGNSSSLLEEVSSEIGTFHKKALQIVEDYNLTSGLIISHQERRRYDYEKLKLEHERLLDMYEGNLVKIEDNLQKHQRRKEKWRSEKAELEMKLSALENKLLEKGENLQTDNPEEQQELTERQKEKWSEKTDLEMKLSALENKCENLQTHDVEEQQELRKELIELFQVYASDQEAIGVKQMGEMDSAAFKDAVRRKLCENDIEDKVSKLCKTWQSFLRNPEWLPFKTVPDGQHKEIVDAEDQKLRMLKTCFGDEAYKVVVATLEEMSEYNPRGRDPVPELWNFPEKREATLKEGLSYLSDHGRARKCRRKCSF